MLERLKQRNLTVKKLVSDGTDADPIIAGKERDESEMKMVSDLPEVPWTGGMKPNVNVKPKVKIVNVEPSAK